MSQPTNPRALLYRKIATVTAAIQRIPKNGKNTFHNYKYATESDLTDGIRELLAEHGLAFLPPTVLSHERIAIEGKGGPLTRVQMQFALADCDTGETIESVLWADGQDAADKGFYKAYTGGVKYFLMKTFLVSTGDDPEQDQRPAQVETRQHTNGKTLVNRAEQQFYLAYGDVIGGATWKHVAEFLSWQGQDWRPATDEDWKYIGEQVAAVAQNPEAAAESAL